MAAVVDNVTVAPYSSVGMLVSTIAGDTFMGTAFVVADNKIFTAAHNLYDKDTQQLATEAYFWLWTNGKNEQPQVWQLSFAENDYAIPQQWTDNEDDADDYDMAVCIIAAQSFAQAAIPLVINGNVLATGQYHTKVIGYQENHDEEDEMCYSESNATALNDEDSCGIVMQSNMVTGCSGGPWIYNDQVIGVTTDASGEDVSSPNNGPAMAELVESLG